MTKRLDKADEITKQEIIILYDLFHTFRSENLKAVSRSKGENLLSWQRNFRKHKKYVHANNVFWVFFFHATLFLGHGATDWNLVTYETLNTSLIRALNICKSVLDRAHIILTFYLKSADDSWSVRTTAKYPSFCLYFCLFYLEVFFLK
jgi:hypothetical protein